MQNFKLLKQTDRWNIDPNWKDGLFCLLVVDILQQAKWTWSNMFDLPENH